MRDRGFKLDAIVTVVDCVNFGGYADTSHTAMMQAKYTDVTLLNKCELVSEDRIDTVLDHVYGLNPDSKVMRCRGKEGVNPDVVFGLDTLLFASLNDVTLADTERLGHADHHDREVDLIQLVTERPLAAMDRATVEQFLLSLSGDQVYRIKGILRLGDGTVVIANFAFGRPDWTVLTRYESPKTLQVVFMGVDLRGFTARIQAFFGVTPDEITFHEAHRHN